MPPVTDPRRKAIEDETIDSLEREHALAAPALYGPLYQDLCASRDGGAIAGDFSLLAGENGLRHALELAFRHAGTPAARERIAAHLADEAWSKWIPLHRQEYWTVLGDDPRMQCAPDAHLASAGWTLPADVARLDGAERSLAAARLLGDLDRISREANDRVDRLASLRARVGDGVSILQVQTLVRAEDARGASWAGASVLEIGPGEGAMLRWVRGAGADGAGIDLEPALAQPWIDRGDFMTHDFGTRRFDAILATAVFEGGSVDVKSGVEAAAENAAGPALLARLAGLVRPGGVAVLENVALPLPFTKQQAEAAGFEVLRQALPLVNVALGGRGCALKKR